MDEEVHLVNQDSRHGHGGCRIQDSGLDVNGQLGASCVMLLTQAIELAALA